MQPQAITPAAYSASRVRSLGRGLLRLRLRRCPRLGRVSAVLVRRNRQSCSYRLGIFFLRLLEGLAFRDAAVEHLRSANTARKQAGTDQVRGRKRGRQLTVPKPTGARTEAMTRAHTQMEKADAGIIMLQPPSTNALPAAVTRHVRSNQSKARVHKGRSKGRKERAQTSSWSPQSWPACQYL